jgi:histidine ammonia-lyase
MAPLTPPPRPHLAIGGSALRLEDVLALAHGRAAPRVHPEAAARMEASRAVVARGLGRGDRIYGVTTGYGESVHTEVDAKHSANLSLNLLRFHGCGTGRLLDPIASAAVMAVRLCSLTAGWSGIRPEVAQRLCVLLDKRILPAIPEEGSVGASGDLTPLSYVAALLVGEREVLGDGGPRPARDVLAEQGLPPLVLGPKEALALMNGTSVATALAVLAFDRAHRLARLTARITAAVSRAIGGNADHFDAVLHRAKGHPGQQTAAAWIRAEFLPHATRGLGGSAAAPLRLQDRYSVRCAPQILGVLVDALTWSRSVLEIELNGVSDNPIVDAEAGRIVHGGNFYGGHVGFVMDGLKVAVANLADLLDRQIVLLCQPGENGNLPANLVGAAEHPNTHHGFKAISIGASALAAEALKLTMPASAFSRSTESHNQDKVPMATIAARDALRIIELTEQIAAMATLAACQAIELRAPASGCGELHAEVRRAVPRVGDDRRMDGDIRAVVELIRADRLTRHDHTPSGLGDAVR